MKPIFQDKFGADPDNIDPATTGNCFQSCIASLLELPIEEVPHFVCEPGNWFSAFERWLADRGFWVHIHEGNVLPSAWSGLVIGNGWSPRGNRHSVLYNCDQLAHDPHPEGGGLEKVESFYFLVPMNPVRS